MKDLEVIFMGTPEFCLPVLDSLIKNTNVSLVVSQPDKLVGRKKILTPTPVKSLALENNIEVFQPLKIREDYKRIIELNPDIIITCAYGQIIPKEILNCPKYGCINVHASLLPYLRGGAPIQHAIIDGYTKTGITIMYMDEAMDTGDIIASREITINKDDTYGSIYTKLQEIAPSLLIEVLPSIINKTNKRIKQDNSIATYAWNIKREEEHIDFNRKGLEIDSLVRGLNPIPYANTIINNIEYKVVSGYFVPDNKVTPNKIVITKNMLGITCLDGIYYITEIKPAGKKVMAIKDFLNGIRINEFKNYEVK